MFIQVRHLLTNALGFNLHSEIIDLQSLMTIELQRCIKMILS